MGRSKTARSSLLYTQQSGQRDRCFARFFVCTFFRQTALGPDEQAFLHNALVFFKRTLDPVYMVAVLVGHLRNNPIIATGLGAKKQIRNLGHHFTNAELAHRTLPEFNDLLHEASAHTATKARKKTGYLLAH